MSLRPAAAGLVLVLAAACGGVVAPVTSPAAHHAERTWPFLHLRHGYAPESAWLKRPENMLAVHETLKKIGYERLLAGYSLDDPAGFLIQDVYVRRRSLRAALVDLDAGRAGPTGDAWVDSFWARRRAEGNEEAAAQVVHDVRAILVDRAPVPVDEVRVDPALYALLALEYGDPPADTVRACAVLHELGLDASAWTVATGQRYAFPPLPEADLAALDATLARSATPPVAVWIDDDTK